MKTFLSVLLLLFACSGLAMAGTPSPGTALKGEVLEAKDVDAYTYLRLKTADGEIWAAVGKAAVKKGAAVTIEEPLMMTNFTSRTLNRTFDRIVFGKLAGAGGPSAPAPAGASLGAMHGGMPQPAAVGDVKVAKATGPGAKTVAEIVASRSELNGKTVAVRGKVVKYSPGIMGKNWLHLRDGSGSAADRTNDVVVTTQDEAKIGDVVLVRGVVHTDVALGAGYAYPVLVEEAKLGK